MPSQKSVSWLQAKIATAMNSIKSGNLAQAEILIREVLPHQPRNTSLLNFLGDIEFKKGNNEESLHFLERSLAITPDQPAILHTTARLLTALGRIREAAATLDKLSNLLPNNHELFKIKANLLEKCGERNAAYEALNRAIELEKDYAPAFSLRGELLLEDGQDNEALSNFDEAIRHSPELAEAHFGRANALRRTGRAKESLLSYDRAIALNPQTAPIHNNKGNALSDLGRYKEAANCYSLATKIDPQYASAAYNLARVCQKVDAHDKAVTYYQKALELDPQHVEAGFNLVTAYTALRQFDTAMELCDKIIEKSGLSPDILNNRGNIFKHTLQFEKALSDYDKALELKPDHYKALNNRGTVFCEMKCFDKAIEVFDQCIALDSTYGDAYWNKAVSLITLGRYAEGWALYEWRWKATLQKDHRTFGKPLWLGQDAIQGKSILIHSEQGLGDTIQFSRYLPMLERFGATVYFECRKPLVSLLSTLKGDFTVIVENAELPDFDVQCPLMSLPHIFGTTVETIPSPPPYFSSSLEKRHRWRELLASVDQGKGRKNIGIVWSGLATYKNDYKRSVQFDSLASLFSLPMNFHSLHKEYREGDLEKFSAFPNLFDHSSDLVDFSDTAALVDELDLVISVDTSTAHLAGALGRPVWILLPWVPDYRWMLDRSDSPWYPSAHLFRQPALQDWDSVIKEIRTELEAFLDAPTPNLS